MPDPTKPVKKPKGREAVTPKKVNLKDFIYTGSQTGDCVGKNCGEIATDFFGTITGKNKNDYIPMEDSWYLRAAMLKDGAITKYDPLKGKAAEKDGIPGMTQAQFESLGSNFDIVTMERNADHSKDKSPNFGQEGNDDADHTGMIINTPQGKRIYHGYNGKYQLSPINEDGTVSLTNGMIIPFDYKIKYIGTPKRIAEYNEQVTQKIDPNTITINPGDRPNLKNAKLNGWNKNYFELLGDADIKKIASELGVSPKEVYKAYILGAGVINNETGTTGVGYLNLKEDIAGVAHAVGYKDDAPSQGAFRMKVDDLMTNRKYQKTLSNLGVDEDDIRLPKESMTKGTVMGFMANYFFNKEKLISNPDNAYDPETETLRGGLPVDYASVYQHNSPGTNLDRKVNGRKLIDWYNDADKGYVNSVFSYLDKIGLGDQQVTNYRNKVKTETEAKIAQFGNKNPTLKAVTTTPAAVQREAVNIGTTADWLSQFKVQPKTNVRKASKEEVNRILNYEDGGTLDPPGKKKQPDWLNTIMAPLDKPRVDNARTVKAPTRSYSESDRVATRVAGATKAKYQGQELARRKAAIAQSNKTGHPADAAVKDKLRLFPNDPNSFVDEYLNPATMIGGMADDLGHALFNRDKSQRTFGNIAAAVAAPLTVGAFAGIGAKNTKQFLDNAVNPFQPLTDRIKNSELPGLTKELTKQGKFRELALLYGTTAAAEVAPIVSKTPGLKKIYKDLAYKAGSYSAAPRVDMGDLGKVLTRKAQPHDYRGVTDTMRSEESRDLLKQYIYGNQPGFNKINEIPEGLEKYQQRYGDMDVFEMKSRVGNGTKLTGDDSFVDFIEYKMKSEGIDVNNVQGKTKRIGLSESDNPIRPLDNIAGHQAWLDNTSGQSELVSQDIWKFTPEDYVDKWAPSGDYFRAKYDKYITKKQATLMDNAGKPFITMSRNPIDFKKSPMVSKIDQDAADLQFKGYDAEIGIGPDGPETGIIEGPEKYDEFGLPLRNGGTIKKKTNGWLKNY